MSLKLKDLIKEDKVRSKLNLVIESKFDEMHFIDVLDDVFKIVKSKYGVTHYQNRSKTAHDDVLFFIKDKNKIPDLRDFLKKNYGLKMMHGRILGLGSGAVKIGREYALAVSGDQLMESRENKMSLKLKDLIKEDWDKKEDENEEITFSVEDKRKFMEAVKKFNQYGKMIYREQDLSSAIDEIGELVETASNLTLHESEDWFDNMTIKRHVKQLKDNLKVFQESAKEVSKLQVRMESAFEDIGGTLNKYFEISEALEESNSKKCKNCKSALPTQIPIEDNCPYCQKPWSIKVK